jgi:hypothetical protein
MDLAERFGIDEYESPAGGCLLTDENYARAVLDLKEHEGLSEPGVRLLSLGRQFRLSERSKLTVGRNHSENERLFALDPPDALYVKAEDFKGPIGVVTGEPSDDDVELAASIVSRYADTSESDGVRVRVTSGDESRRVTVVPLGPRDVREFAI